MKKIYAFVILLSMGITNYAQAQCYQCTGSAFSIGAGTASGNNSFAGGYQSVTSTDNSFVFGNEAKVYGLRGIALGNEANVYQTDGIAIGNRAISNALNSYVFGKDITGSGSNSITIGVGASSLSPLVNNKSNSSLA